MAERASRLTRGDFRIFRAIPTRWHDNDVYGHVNNVVYYGWFDTAVNAWLIENGLLDPTTSEIVGLVVETGCSYFESVAFPETVEAGIAVERLGTSSVTYRIGIFRQGSEQAAAQGRFTHVYVARASQKPVPIPVPLRAALTAIQS
ncbi:acyl-CoA thioesterase [Bosea sp. SSUT16]|uniref:Acyl-CoA thioesterase n=1 Tax=Bosea spartocytisi TaxID=2773451 RepID=A0A927EDP9_9HYPH|nr:thioesterase family protein [Bosea spartocytisi]MBD3848904.1 acyl-CoA thioesterase [Bosea spartocytisi]MCT4474984.1 acyl-CoA thioesterase [Bosea spartocytisi]